MIVLDTNVISELMRQTPSVAVVGWLDRQPRESVWTTSICVFEVAMGLRLLPHGQRRRGLEDRFAVLMTQVLSGRVLSLDTPAAFAAAHLAGQNQPRGISTEFRDLLIAGTVAHRKGTLATRNARHFAHAGIALIDPWNL